MVLVCVVVIVLLFMMYSGWFVVGLNNVMVV